MTKPLPPQHLRSRRARSTGSPPSALRAPAADRPPDPTNHTLTPEQQQFLVLAQTLRYGLIHRLRVHDGRPDLRGPIHWTRAVKVGGDNTPHPQRDGPGFALRGEVLDFFRLLRELGTGEIRNVEVRNGLPVRFDVDEVWPGVTGAD